MDMSLKSSANGKRMRLFHIWTQFNFFVSGSDVLACDFREISSKMEMTFLFRSRGWSFLQNNVYRHRQTTYLLVFGP